MRRRRIVLSITVPVVLASVAVALSIGLLIGWTLLIAQNLTVASAEFGGNVWLLVLGILSFAFIMGVLVSFSIFLAREIIEVRRQDSFIDSVTHELKSPLASLKLCIETLGREGVPEDKREEIRQMMLDDVDRLSSFIDDVLSASRVAHERTGMTVSDVELRELVGACAEYASSRHHLARERIRIDVDEGLSLATDPVAMEVVIKNLLDNALKYSGKSPEVTVRARRAAGRVVIEVIDRGIGIDKKHLRRVFHRFYRVPSETVRERKGTGLGLFVVSILVRNLGGKVRALSDGPGQGTTIRIDLPARVEGDAGAAS
jgi:signal transduction histidine kinase